MIFSPFRCVFVAIKLYHKRRKIICINRKKSAVYAYLGYFTIGYNYIALGDNILEFVKEKSKQKYGFYKIFNRDGFLNIIPKEATEEQIEQYLQGLKSDSL
jgi:hypothetical protein